MTSSAVTWRTYANTVWYALLVWAVTLPLGFGVAWLLSFHVRSAAAQPAPPECSVGVGRAADFHLGVVVSAKRAAHEMSYW